MDDKLKDKIVLLKQLQFASDIAGEFDYCPRPDDTDSIDHFIENIQSCDRSYLLATLEKFQGYSSWILIVT